MLKLNDPASIAEALDDPGLDPDLGNLIRRLALDLGHSGAVSIVVVIEAGDSPAVINAAVGSSITGDGAGELCFDWIKDHDGRWFEIALTPPAGVPTRVLVDNDAGTELGLHYACLAHFWPDDEEPVR